VIDFRYHVVSIVAVFLALALGLFIGGTSLRGTFANDITNRTDQVFNNNKRLEGEVSSLQAQLNDQQQFETATEPYILRSALAGHSVVVVSAPGVDDGTRKNVLDALETAGATVSGDVRLQDGLFDPQQRTFLETLVGRLAVPGRNTPTGTGAQQAMTLLAEVLGIRPQSTPISPSAASRVLSGYVDGKLITVNGGVARSGSLALLLAPPPPSGTPDPKATQSQNDLLLDLARALDRNAVGAVLAGPASSADTAGLLQVARDDKDLTDSVSTIDGVDLPSGVIATVLALAEQADGRAGNYGSEGGAQAPLPTPSPS
jgi:hypothetical protein